MILRIYIYIYITQSAQSQYSHINIVYYLFEIRNPEDSPEPVLDLPMDFYGRYLPILPGVTWKNADFYIYHNDEF